MLPRATPQQEPRAGLPSALELCTVGTVGHCRPSERGGQERGEKRDAAAGRRHAVSGFPLEAHDSQLESVPLSPFSEGASWIPLILSSEPRPRWGGSCKDSH